MTAKAARKILRKYAAKLVSARSMGVVPRWLDRLWRKATAAAING